MPRLALYQPDIPQNTGTMLRTAACLGVAVEIIEPAGFDVSDRHFRRAGLDYLDAVAITRHPSWQAFEAWRRQAGLRLVLATTRAATVYWDFAWDTGDVACRTPCTRPPTRGSSSRCGRACARSTSRWRPA
jgi:tRNA (cytidine/uridine-2'-O-)-methyltransferase